MEKKTKVKVCSDVIGICKGPFEVSGYYINASDGEHLIHFNDSRATEAILYQVCQAINGNFDKCSFKANRLKRFFWSVSLNGKIAVFSVYRDWYHQSKFADIPLKDVVRINNEAAEHIARIMERFNH